MGAFPCNAIDEHTIELEAEEAAAAAFLQGLQKKSEVLVKNMDACHGYGLSWVLDTPSLNYCVIP